VLPCILSEIFEFLHKQAAHHVLLEGVNLLPLELFDHFLDLSIGNETYEGVIVLYQFKLIVHVIV